MKSYILIIPFFSLFNNILFSQTSSELFIKDKMEYKGDKIQQAKLLMRKISIFGKILEKQAQLDSNYLILLNNEIGISKQQLKNYLKDTKIDEQKLGGSIDGEISFIIHNRNRVPPDHHIFIS